MTPSWEMFLLGAALGWALGIGFCILTLEWFQRHYHLRWTRDGEEPPR